MTIVPRPLMGARPANPLREPAAAIDTLDRIPVSHIAQARVPNRRLTSLTYRSTATTDQAQD
jgi:hypothetical protein